MYEIGYELVWISMKKYEMNFLVGNYELNSSTNLGSGIDMNWCIKWFYEFLARNSELILFHTISVLYLIWKYEKVWKINLLRPHPNKSILYWSFLLRFRVACCLVLEIPAWEALILSLSDTVRGLGINRDSDSSMNSYLFMLIQLLYELDYEMNMQTTKKYELNFLVGNYYELNSSTNLGSGIDMNWCMKWFYEFLARNSELILFHTFSYFFSFVHCMKKVWKSIKKYENLWRPHPNKSIIYRSFLLRFRVACCLVLEIAAWEALILSLSDTVRGLGIPRPLFHIHIFTS